MYLISPAFARVHYHKNCNKMASQIFATLFLGHMMKKLGSRRIFLISTAVTAIFNTSFFVVDLVSGGDLFIIISVILICLTSLGDAGIFCSNYVLAAKQTKELRKREKSGALGPAIIETMQCMLQEECLALC